MLQFFSHSWICVQKRATYGQYKNKWSNDSASSQQNLQSWEDCIPHTYNILLVARILYKNLNWKMLSFESSIIVAWRREYNCCFEFQRGLLDDRIHGLEVTGHVSTTLRFELTLSWQKVDLPNGPLRGMLIPKLRFDENILSHSPEHGNEGSFEPWRLCQC